MIDISNRSISQMSRVFANSMGDQGSILGRVIPKTPKMVLDAALLNIQPNVKWNHPGNGVEPSSTPRVVAVENGAFGSPSTKVAKFTYF